MTLCQQIFISVDKGSRAQSVVTHTGQTLGHCFQHHRTFGSRADCGLVNEATAL